jgi:hypothetical protein
MTGLKRGAGQASVLWVVAGGLQTIPTSKPRRCWKSAKATNSSVRFSLKTYSASNDRHPLRCSVRGSQSRTRIAGARRSSPTGASSCWILPKGCAYSQPSSPVYRYRGAARGNHRDLPRPRPTRPGRSPNRESRLRRPDCPSYVGASRLER